MAWSIEVLPGANWFLIRSEEIKLCLLGEVDGGQIAGSASNAQRSRVWDTTMLHFSHSRIASSKRLARVLSTRFAALANARASLSPWGADSHHESCEWESPFSCRASSES